MSAASTSKSASPSPGPNKIEGGIPTPANRHAPTAVEVQRMQLARLLKDPAKPVHIPTAPREKTIRPAREMMKNVQGSSAGAGSGEFHVYKASRRREYERLKLMDEMVQKEAAEREFEMKKRQWEEEADAKTAKNRAKRLKKKGKVKEKEKEKEKEKGKGGSSSAAAGTSASKFDSGAQAGREDAPLKKRRLVNGEVMVFRKPGEEGGDETSEEDEPGPVLPAEPEPSANSQAVEDQPRGVIAAAKVVIHEDD